MKPDDALLALAGLCGSRVNSVRPLTTESRNSLWRVTLDGPVPRAVLKAYHPDTDPHAANRFRREEKTLTLLASAVPPVAPRVLAGFISAHGPSLLLMEDAGEMTLAQALQEDGPGIWDDAVKFVGRLHGEMARLRQSLYRTASAISLDRITAVVVTNRFRAVGKRLLDREPDAQVLREYRALMAPLIAAPRAMIHNSLSPLNIVRSEDGWRAIDWETLAHASPVWDWAEFLRAPYNPLPYEESAALATEASRVNGDLFDRAVLSRALDGLGTVTLRRRRYQDESNLERAVEYERRSKCYRIDIREARERLSVPAALGSWLDTLTGELP